MGLFSRKDDLESLARRAKQLEVSKSERSEDLEVLRREAQLWRPKRLLSTTGGYSAGYSPDWGVQEGKPKRNPANWPRALIWEWEAAGSEEERDEVFNSYVSWLYHNPTLGFDREKATRTVSSVLTRWQRKGEEL